MHITAAEFSIAANEGAKMAPEEIKEARRMSNQHLANRPGSVPRCHGFQNAISRISPAT